MGMMNHSTKPVTPAPSKKLTRGATVKVANQVKREEVVDDGTVTLSVTIRVDNHLRNKITALLNVGMGESQKDVVDLLVDEKVSSLDDTTKKRFKDMYSILEKKDYLKSIK